MSLQGPTRSYLPSPPPVSPRSSSISFISSLLHPSSPGFLSLASLTTRGAHAAPHGRRPLHQLAPPRPRSALARSCHFASLPLCCLSLSSNLAVIHHLSSFLQRGCSFRNVAVVAGVGAIVSATRSLFQELFLRPVSCFRNCSATQALLQKDEGKKSATKRLFLKLDLCFRN